MILSIRCDGAASGFAVKAAARRLRPALTTCARMPLSVAVIEGASWSHLASQFPIHNRARGLLPRRAGWMVTVTPLGRCKIAVSVDGSHPRGFLPRMHAEFGCEPIRFDRI